MRTKFACTAFSTHFPLLVFKYFMTLPSYKRIIYKHVFSVLKRNFFIIKTFLSTTKQQIAIYNLYSTINTFFKIHVINNIKTNFTSIFHKFLNISVRISINKAQ